MILFLPYPPSVNTYWRSVVIKRKVRVLISAEGRKYRTAVIASIAEQLKMFPKAIAGPVHVHLWACSPDKRRRDLDNLPKAVFDACTHARVWHDDSQIQKFTVEWASVAKASSWDHALKHGSIALEITPLPEAPS